MRVSANFAAGGLQRILQDSRVYLPRTGFPATHTFFGSPCLMAQCSVIICSLSLIAILTTGMDSIVKK